MEVIDNAEASRWEARVDGQLAGIADYVDDGTTVAYTHTFVDPAFGGGKIASDLIKAALDDAAGKERRIEPMCSFVQRYVERHAEYQPLLAGR